jgi:CubicO group peptidase (beta-lactamase class C family)
MHIQKGAFNGHQILPRQHLDDLLCKADETKIAKDSYGAIDLPGFAYRSQYAILRGHGAYNAGGAWGQTCYVHPGSETVIVKFSTCPSIELYETEIRAFQKIASQLAELADG